MCGTNLLLGWGGMKTLKPPLSSLHVCCDVHSLPMMTFTEDTCFQKLRWYTWYRMESIWEAAIPRRPGFFLNPWFPTTSSLANSNSYSLTLSAPLSYGLSAMHLLEPSGLESHVTTDDARSEAGYSVTLLSNIWKKQSFLISLKFA